MEENKKITIQDIKNALLITNNRKIEGAPFGGKTIDFRLNNDKLEFSRQQMSGGIKWLNIEEKGNEIQLASLTKEAGSLLEVIEEKNKAEAKARLEKELEKQKAEQKLEDIENTKKQEEEQEKLKQQEQEKLRLAEAEEKQRIEEEKLKEVHKEEALNQIKKNLNDLLSGVKKEEKNENHDLTFGILIKDKGLEDLQKIADGNPEDFEQLVKDELTKYLNKEANNLNKEVGNLNINNTGEISNLATGLDSKGLGELLPLLDEKNLKNHLQDISNNKTTSDLVTRLEVLGAGDQSQNLANQLVMNKGIEYVGDLVNNEDTSLIIAKDVLELKLNSEVKDNYQASVFAKIFNSQNQDRENPQSKVGISLINVATSLIKVAINEDNLQKEIVDFYKEILSKNLTSLKNPAENNNPLREEAILKIAEDINKLSDKEKFLPFLSDLNSKIEEQTKEIQDQKRKEKGRGGNKEDVNPNISSFFESAEKEAVEIEEQNKKQLEEESKKRAEKEIEQKVQLNVRLSKMDKFRDEDYKGSDNRGIIIDSLKGSLDVIELPDDKFKEAIDEQWKICVNAEIDVIKEKLRDLKFKEEEEVGQKATVLASSPAIAKDLSSAATSEKDQDGNDGFAIKAFKIKLKEALPNASEEDLQIYVNKTTDNIIAQKQENKDNKDNKITEESTLEINQKLINIASDPEQMKEILASVKIKSDEKDVDIKNEKDQFYLEPEQKKDLENRSEVIGKSIENYLSAKKEGKTEAKKNLLELLDPTKQNDFPKHPTFQLLARLATDVLDDNKMKKKDGSLVKGQDEMLRLIGKEFLDFSKEENKKDAKGYDGVVQNMARSCAVIDKEYDQKEDGLTTRLSDRFYKSLEENKESLENEGLDLKKNLARVFKVAGFATLCAVGGPFGFIAGMIFLYLFRNLGEGKSPEEKQKEEEFERERQAAVSANMAMASRSAEKDRPFPKTEEVSKEFAKKAEDNLKTVQKNLEENKDALKGQDDKDQKITQEVKENDPEGKKENVVEKNVESNQSSKENQEIIKKMKESLKLDSSDIKNIRAKDDIQERSSKRSLKLEGLNLEDFASLKNLSKDDSELGSSKKRSFTEDVLKKEESKKNQFNEIS